MKYFKILTCVLTTLIIASCNTANVKHQAFNSVTKPVTRQDSALVYVYRHKKGTEYTLGTVNITVNNKYSFGLKDSRFTYIYLTPGPHTFKASWSLWDKPLFEGGQFDSKTTTYNFEAG
ncbi:MAG: hypothetical protein GY834_16335, partial [Bacteroidetes bacterium]|nr:hypothetical protein [Bacteroidota bacterium]